MPVNKNCFAAGGLICLCKGHIYNIILDRNQVSFMLINTAFGQTMAFRIVARLQTSLPKIGHFDKFRTDNVIGWNWPNATNHVISSKFQTVAAVEIH